MGIFNGFICDKCGKEFRSNSRDYKPVTISLSITFGRTSHSQLSDTKNEVWCRECIMKTGIAEPATTEDKKVAPETKLTLEEKVTMLIEELGFTREF